MTAPAAAPASGPIAPAAPRAAPQPPADRFAFAAVLDSLPGAPAKAGAPTAEEQPHPSNESPQDESSRGQTARHSLLNDSALLASLPFALRAASMMDERPQAADNSPSLASPAMKGPKSEDSGASIAAGAKAATVGRLIGERAFHFGASTFAGAIASRALAVDAPFAPGAASAANLTAQADLNGESALAAGFSPAEAMPAKPSPDAVPPSAQTRRPRRQSPLARARLQHIARASREQPRTRPRAADKSPKSRRLRLSPGSRAPPRSTRQRNRAARRPTVARPIRPPSARRQQRKQTCSARSCRRLSPQARRSNSTARRPAPRNADVAPRASALGPGSAPSTPPVREIDVDLSPGGLENVSMTMRLAGDKLSVVIRAASSQTLGSIEGARDAIADRMAAIGQPLDSLIVKQTGVNTDGNANGNASSADGGSSGGERRSAQARAGRFERCVVSARRWSRSQFLAAAPRAPTGRSLASGR